MGGLLGRLDLSFLTSAVVWIGGGSGFLLLVGLVIIFVKKDRELALVAAFLLFLNWSFFFIAALGRVTTNDLYYPLFQFRYQYVPNALLFFLAPALVARLLKPGRRRTAAVCCLLLPVLVVNVIQTESTLKKIAAQLEPLRELIINVRLAIDRGIINETAKVYIDDRVVFYYPPLAWNRKMDPFFEGTVQWLFPARDIGCFSFEIENAAWLVEADLGRYENGFWKPWVGKRNLVSPEDPPG
jgi:hypothetical protein